ncbi:MAG: hypothetical protein RQ745_09655 [Longimicrobiales bacterium]|nr:hypothetical protein [Longimicrobiales bacterium]
MLPASAGSAPPPPPLLPGEHFAAALLFLIAGAAGLISAAPALAAGAFLSPRVVATTHLFTLGWITTAIMGALHQFMPVALGRPVRSIRVAHVSFALHVTGLPTFVAGLATGSSRVLVVGAVLLALGLSTFIVNLWATLAGARRRDLTWWTLLAASLFLLMTIGLGLVLTGNLRWAFLGADRIVALGVHLHLALFGWVFLVIVGVAHHLLPMFLLSHTEGDRLARAAAVLTASGAAAVFALHHAAPPFSRTLPALLLGGGVAAFLAHAARLYRHRHRRALDPGMQLAAVALFVLAAGGVPGARVAAGGASPQTATLYIVLVLGSFTLFVAAHLYKIIPFLVWHHRIAPLAGHRSPLPRVADLFSAGWARTAGGALGTGVLGLALGVQVGSTATVRVSAILFLAGALTQSVQLVRLAHRRPT